MAAVLLAAACSDPPPPEVVAGSEADLEQMVTEVREVHWSLEFLADQVTAACMREQGFEYWPRPLDNGAVPEYSEEAVFVEFDDNDSPLDETLRRNMEYIDSLDPATLSAFDDALYRYTDDAPSIAVSLSDGSVVEMANAGCLPDARTEVLGGDGRQELMTEILGESEGLLFDLDDRVYAKGAYTSASDELRRCVRGEGFDIDGVEMNVDRFLGAIEDDAAAVATVEDCVAELDIDRRFQLLLDCEAYAMLQGDEDVERVLLLWQENREEILGSLKEAERAVLAE